VNNLNQAASAEGIRCLLQLRRPYESFWWEYRSNKAADGALGVARGYSAVRSLYVDAYHLPDPPPDQLSARFVFMDQNDGVTPDAALSEWISLIPDDKHRTGNYCIYQSEQLRADKQHVVNGAYLYKDLLPATPPTKIWMLLERVGGQLGGSI
jgi:hypothetical protein